MFYVLLSALCSVLVSVLLKLAKRRDIDVGQAIAWNYVAAGALTAWVFQPSTAPLSGSGVPWIGMIGLGLLLPTIFLALAASVRTAGIVRSDTAQRLSLLISLLAAFTLFGEAPNALKLTGLGLGLVALICMLQRSEQPQLIRQEGSWQWPLAVFLGFGAIDILLKLVAQAGIPFATSLLAAFVLSFVVAMTIFLSRCARGQTRPRLRDTLAGLLLGLANFGNIVFYVRAHQALAQHPALVFASMNLGVVILGALAGRFGFGERLRVVHLLGLLLAVAAIGLLGYAAQA
ncbi:MAG TPA: EamA/RhaT family transporter [Dyella sp.]|uniref:EamA family transporter n=1 Tax=Dyella sp. TaxID=1869338 RepID=UPI002F9570C0